MRNYSESQPFKYNLNSIKSDKVYEFDTEDDVKNKLNPHNDKIVRRFADYLPHEKEFGDKGIDSMIEFIKKNESFYEELEGEYNINIPSQNSVIASGEKGHDSGGRMIYTVVDKIEGETLNSLKFSKDEYPEMRKKIEELYLNLVQYLIDKHKKGEEYLRDVFSSSQYMLGVNKEDVDKKLYLVDVEPLFNEEPRNEYGKYYQEAQCLWSAMTSIKFLEHKTGDVEFEKAREKIKECLDLFDLDGSVYLTATSVIGNIKGYLGNKEDKTK
jgi:hypothetical protein